MGWRNDAVVWFTDDKRGRLLAGSFGFVWWSKDKVFCAPFPEYQRYPISAVKTYALWNAVKIYRSDDVSLNSLVRFVRSGLMP